MTSAGGACPVSHVEWCCRDLQRAMRFFEALFGWRFERISRHYALHVPAAQGPRVGLMEREVVPASGGLALFVTVPGLEPALEQVRALGGRIAEAPRDIPGYGRWAQFHDPDGNRIGLFQAAAPDPTALEARDDGRVN